MTYLIISDVHSNREALEAVHADADGRCGQTLCLGDVVGYCADPNFTTDQLRLDSVVTVRGNHDCAATGLFSTNTFNRDARTAALWTREHLSDDNFAWLQALPQGPLSVNGTGRDAFDLVHGSPVDENDYLDTIRDAASARAAITLEGRAHGGRVTFFGHTHYQGGFISRRNTTRKVNPQDNQGTLQLSNRCGYLLNPGSVGQPRDGDPRAAYATYSPETQTIEFRRVKYDVATAGKKIRAAGLPASLAERLVHGR
jgi:predicted phosphodiesterase